MARPSIKARRQLEIIQAFYKVSCDIGLENTSFGKVAQHMDVNPSLLVHYFKSKEDLLIAVIDFILQKYQDVFLLEEEILCNDSFRQMIDRLFSRSWNTLFDDGVFYSCYALIFRNKNLRTRFRYIHDQLHEQLTEVIAKANDLSIVSVDNAKEISKRIFALVDGMYYYMAMVEDEDKEEMEQSISMYRQWAYELLGMAELEVVGEVA